jgi:hypothetical protein
VEIFIMKDTLVSESAVTYDWYKYNGKRKRVYPEHNNQGYELSLETGDIFGVREVKKSGEFFVIDKDAQNIKFRLSPKEIETLLKYSTKHGGTVPNPKTPITNTEVSADKNNPKSYTWFKVKNTAPVGKTPKNLVIKTKTGQTLKIAPGEHFGLFSANPTRGGYALVPNNEFAKPIRIDGEYFAKMELAGRRSKSLPKQLQEGKPNVEVEEEVEVTPRPQPKQEQATPVEQLRRSVGKVRESINDMIAKIRSYEEEDVDGSNIDGYVADLQKDLKKYARQLKTAADAASLDESVFEVFYDLLKESYRSTVKHMRGIAAAGTGTQPAEPTQSPQEKALIELAKFADSVEAEFAEQIATAKAASDDITQARIALAEVRDLRDLRGASFKKMIADSGLKQRDPKVVEILDRLTTAFRAAKSAINKEIDRIHALNQAKRDDTSDDFTPIVTPEPDEEEIEITPKDIKPTPAPAPTPKADSATISRLLREASGAASEYADMARKSTSIEQLSKLEREFDGAMMEREKTIIDLADSGNVDIQGNTRLKNLLSEFYQKKVAAQSEFSLMKVELMDTGSEDLETEPLTPAQSPTPEPTEEGEPEELASDKDIDDLLGMFDEPKPAQPAAQKPAPASPADNMFNIDDLDAPDDGGTDGDADLFNLNDLDEPDIDIDSEDLMGPPTTPDDEPEEEEPEEEQPLPSDDEDLFGDDNDLGDVSDLQNAMGLKRN